MTLARVMPALSMLKLYSATRTILVIRHRVAHEPVNEQDFRHKQVNRSMTMGSRAGGASFHCEKQAKEFSLPEGPGGFMRVNLQNN